MCCSQASAWRRWRRWAMACGCGCPGARWAWHWRRCSPSMACWRWRAPQRSWLCNCWRAAWQGYLCSAPRGGAATTCERPCGDNFRMLELIQITNDPAFAQRCDALGGFRLFVDLERAGKAERQAGRNTFISTHQVEDVGRVKRVLQRSRLMVRVNPLHAGTASEIDAVLA